MGFLSPITALIAAAITIPALVLLYFLKLRRRKVMVASTLLWRKAVQDLQVNAPFQKLRRNLLLLIQLLLLIALLIAMARPTQRTLVEPGKQVVILLDHSASMNASVSGDQTRLQQAKDRALELIDAIEAGSADADSASGGAMVVSFAHRAQVVQPFTRDPTLLRAAVRSVRPTDQLTNIAGAIDLVRPFAQAADASEEKGLTVYALTDGRAHLPESGELALPGAELRYLKVGGEDAAKNLAIVSFSARRDFEKPQIVSIFARVANYGPESVEANLTLSLDGKPVRVQPVRVPAAQPPQQQPGGRVTFGDPGNQSVQFDLVLTDAALLELRHDFDDVLEADNAAWLTLAPARRLRVLLVTEGNAFLERVIRSTKVRDLVLMTPDKFENQDPALLQRGGWDAAGLSGAEGFDVIVFDGYSPHTVPTVDSLYLGGVPPIEGFALRPPLESDRETQVILDWQRDHALMRYVVLDDVVLSRPSRMMLPTGGVVLATGQHGPLMAEVTVEGARHVVTSFNVLSSNWPLYVSFPVFISNSLQVLGLGNLADEAGIGLRTGQVAVVPVEADLERVTYRGPSELSGRVSRGRAILEVFERVGVYQTGDDVQPPDDRLAVSLLDPLESDTRVAPALEVGTIASQGASTATSIRKEVWPWFVWAALAVLLVEWLVYTRRMHL